MRFINKEKDVVKNMSGIHILQDMLDEAEKAGEYSGSGSGTVYSFRFCLTIAKLYSINEH